MDIKTFITKPIEYKEVINTLSIKSVRQKIMITLERFSKNINLMHLATITGNDDVVLKVMRGLLVFFPNGREEIEHFAFFCNFGLLKGHEMEIEELYNKLLENETKRPPKHRL